MSTTPLSPPILHPGRGMLPVLLSVPHAGRDYPDWLVRMAAAGAGSLTTLEDPLVDRLTWRALQAGVGAVVAATPRAAVDCNRAADEVDPAIVLGASRQGMSARTRGGLGVVPSRTQSHGHLWRRAIDSRQFAERLDQAYHPYHALIERELEALRSRFGCALLLDCHSMPPPSPGVPPIVIGDRHGRSSGRTLSVHAIQIAAAAGFEARLNDPFAGGHIIERHGAPDRQIHALQIEIDRRCYLAEGLRDPSDNFDAVARLIEQLAVGLGELLLDRPEAIAAE